MNLMKGWGRNYIHVNIVNDWIEFDGVLELSFENNLELLMSF